MKTAYTYAILRYIHDTLSGESLNVGVALYAPDLRYASALCRPTYARLSRVFPGLDGEAFKGMMRFVQARFEEAGSRLRDELSLAPPPGTVLDLAHGFLPHDDSSLQWSTVGSGLSDDPSRTLEQLYERLVMKYDEKQPRESRTDDEVWRSYRRILEARNVLAHLHPKTIAVADDAVEFQYAWKNRIWHCLEPISFDLSTPDSIRDKAHRYLGQITSVKNSPEAFKVHFLLGEPRQHNLRPAFENAVKILEKVEVDKQLVRETDAEVFSARLLEAVVEHVQAGT